MKLAHILKRFPAAAMLLCGAAASAQEAPAGEWVFGIDAYLWAPSLSGKTQSGDPIDVDFGTISSDLNFGAMAYLSARRDRLAFYLDSIYLNLEDEDRTTANIVGSPLKVDAKAELQGVVSTLGATYRVVETEKVALEAGVGGRLLWLDADLKFDVGPVQRNVSDSSVNIDGVIGLRGRADITDDWYLIAESDVGTGDSDLTWQAWGTLNYRWDAVTFAAGYRYLAWYFDNDADVLKNLKLHGPIFGVRFRF